MKNIRLVIMVLLSVIPLGCSRDYSVDLGNGYSYEHWGNNFISHTEGGAMRQVIKGQVESYLKHDDFILAVQTDLGTPVKRYYVLDVSTGGIEQFSEYADFAKKASQINFTEEELRNLSRS